MFKYVFAILFLFFGNLLNMNAQVFQWGKANGGISIDQAYCLGVDAWGNVYVTGTFQGQCDFDPGPGLANLISAGSYDIFVQKLDASGNLVWAKRFGSTLADYGQAIAVDTWGNILIAGYFQSTVDFDPGAASNTLTSTGSGDAFVLKLDSAAGFRWAVNFGSTGIDIAYGIAVDEGGSAYTTGYFNGTADFQQGPGTTGFTSLGGTDIFIQKTDSAGNFVWARRVGSVEDDQGNSIYSAGGFVYTGGEYKGSADFNPGAGVVNLTCMGGTDGFVQKLDTAGNFAWAKKISGANYEKVLGITADTAGNVFSTGHFENTADFDPSTSGVFEMTDYGILDAFVQKLDENGLFVWARQLGGTDFDEGLSLDADEEGNVYVTGYFTDSADFHTQPGRNRLISSGSQDVFVAKLGAQGNLVSAKSVGSAGLDFGYSLRLRPGGNEICLAGSLYGAADLDPGPGISNVQNAGSWDCFSSKWTQCTSSASHNFSSCGPFSSPSGNFVWDSSGVYTDWMAGASGCDSVLTIQLTVNEIDTGVSVSIFTLSSQQSGATYRWLDCMNANAVIPGETSSSYTPTVSGSYAVEITLGGCVDTSACMMVNMLGREQPGADLQVTCFPNPASDKLYVTCSSGLPESIEMLGVDGRKVASLQPRSSQTEISLDGFPAGLYIVKINVKGSFLFLPVQVMR